MNFMNTQALSVGVGFAIIQFITIMIVIYLAISLLKTKRRMSRLFKGTSIDNVEQLIHHHTQQIVEAQQRIQSLEKETARVKQLLKMKKGNVSIVRYNAFDQGGSDQSFSIAIVNEDRTGVVMTGLHNREHTHIYAKPVEKGESKYLLSSEEKLAIQNSLHD